MDLLEVEGVAATCRLCDLHIGRKNPVFAKGVPNSALFICGMVPAKEENEVGLPFVGRAGKLLDNILEDVGLDLSCVYITNLVKCFLAAGKPLKPEWVEHCFPYLLAQIALIKPKVIITLGKDAAFTLLGKTKGSLGEIRGKFFDIPGSVVLPTYHPSFVLRKGGVKSKEYNIVVQDFKKALDVIR